MMQSERDLAIADYRKGVPIKIILHRYRLRHKRLYRSWLADEQRRYPKMSAAKRKKLQ